MVSEQKGFFRRTAEALGLIGSSNVRSSELPITVSPNAPINAVNLTNSNATAVSTDRALGLAGVFRAVSIISGGISQLELGAWRAGIEVPQTSNSMLVRPDYDQSLAAFLEQTVVSMAVNGNAYWLLNKTGPTANVMNISVMNPQMVSIETDKGTTYYREGDKRFPAWKVKHLMLTRLPGYVYGVGPIQACQNELRGALNLRNYADNWFTDAGVPNGVLKTDQSITPEMADAYRTRWQDNLASNRMQVLGNGITYTPIYLNPADAQFLENQQFSQAQIARIFGVPSIAMDLPSGDSMTYSNREDVMRDFYTFTLRKYMTEIEAAFSDLLVRGQQAKFKTEPLLQANSATRYAAYKTALDAKILTLDEVRAKEGLPPIGGQINIEGENTNG